MCIAGTRNCSKSYWLTHLLKHNIMKICQMWNLKIQLPVLHPLALQCYDLVMITKLIVLLLPVLQSGMNYNASKYLWDEKFFGKDIHKLRFLVKYKQ